MIGSDRLPPVLHNVLPLRFRTWAALYDSIPESQRQEPHFQFFQGVTKKQFARVYGYAQPAHIVGKAEHLIDREWLLARIGEELLPARLTITEWKELRAGLQNLTVSEKLHIGADALPRLLQVAIRE